MRKLKLVIEETDDTGTITTTLPLAFAMDDDMGRPVAGVYDKLKSDHRRLRFATWLMPAVTEAIVQANYGTGQDSGAGIRGGVTMRKLKLVIEETDDTGTITTTLPLAFAMDDDMGRPVAGVYDKLKSDHRRLRFATWLMPAVTEAIVQANYGTGQDSGAGI